MELLNVRLLQGHPCTLSGFRVRGAGFRVYCVLVEILVNKMMLYLYWAQVYMKIYKSCSARSQLTRFSCSGFRDGTCQDLFNFRSFVSTLNP